MILLLLLLFKIQSLSPKEQIKVVEEEFFFDFESPNESPHSSFSQKEIFQSSNSQNFFSQIVSTSPSSSPVNFEFIDQLSLELIHAKRTSLEYHLIFQNLTIGELILDKNTLSLIDIEDSYTHTHLENHLVWLGFLELIPFFKHFIINDEKNFLDNKPTQKFLYFDDHFREIFNIQSAYDNQKKKFFLTPAHLKKVGTIHYYLVADKEYYRDLYLQYLEKLKFFRENNQFNSYIKLKGPTLFLQELVASWEIFSLSWKSRPHHIKGFEIDPQSLPLPKPSFKKSFSRQSSSQSSSQSNSSTEDFSFLSPASSLPLSFVGSFPSILPILTLHLINSLSIEPVSTTIGETEYNLLSDKDNLGELTIIHDLDTLDSLSIYSPQLSSLFPYTMWLGFKKIIPNTPTLFSHFYSNNIPQLSHPQTFFDEHFKSIFNIQYDTEYLKQPHSYSTPSFKFSIIPNLDYYKETLDNYLSKIRETKENDNIPLYIELKGPTSFLHSLVHNWSTYNKKWNEKLLHSDIPLQFKFLEGSLPYPHISSPPSFLTMTSSEDLSPPSSQILPASSLLNLHMEFLLNLSFQEFYYGSTFLRITVISKLNQKNVGEIFLNLHESTIPLIVVEKDYHHLGIEDFILWKGLQKIFPLKSYFAISIKTDKINSKNFLKKYLDSHPYFKKIFKKIPFHLLSPSLQEKKDTIYYQLTGHIEFYQKLKASLDHENTFQQKENTLKKHTQLFSVSLFLTHLLNNSNQSDPPRDFTASLLSPLLPSFSSQLISDQKLILTSS